MVLWTSLCETVAGRMGRDERGAIGWLAIGIIVGALLVIGLIIKLLIPGE